MKKGEVAELRKEIRVRNERVDEVMTTLDCKEQTISLLYNLLKFAVQKKGEQNE